MTLQNRITSLMVFSSILFIAVFTFIQLNNQIANINRYNTYQANLSSIIVKYNIETTLSQLSPEGISKPQQYLNEVINDLRDAKIIKDLVVFNHYGEIIASTRDNSVGSNVNYRDIKKTEELSAVGKEGKWLIPQIDTENKQLDLFLLIKTNIPGIENIYVKMISPLANIQDALKSVYIPVIIAMLVVILANIIFGYILSKTVIGPIRILNDVTKIIAKGDLSVRTNIDTNDELEELGSTFNAMTEELIKMKARAENANPLTKLPGNIVIHEQIEERIRNDRKFVVIYCDLDNFKAFNDKYGISKGDEAIKMTSDIFKEAAQAKGSPDDFVGHEGGDDFLLISSPETAQSVADYIIQEFDKRVRSLYDEEDLNRGYIVAHSRDGSIQNFPIMTISLAGVTNEHRKISSYAEVTNIAAELKKKAKSINSSVFVMDKRHT